GLSAGSRGSRFAVPHGALAVRLVPVVPALGPHGRRHVGLQKRRLREGPPRPPEVGQRVGRAGDPAAGEDESVRRLARRGGRGDVTVAPDVDTAALEPRRRAAEDEVHVSCDERVFEILAAAIQEDRVLPPEEAAVAEYHAIAVDTDGECLAVRTGGVLE